MNTQVIKNKLDKYMETATPEQVVKEFEDLGVKFLITQFNIQEYTNQKLPCGKYLVVRKDGKIHFEVYNGTGWAYNDNSITHFYLPAIK